MLGVKRHHDGGVKKQVEVLSSPFMPMFETFRNELDEHHDRRERIIKASRDITAASKKIIFALQRMRSLKTDIPPKIASEIQERSLAMQKQFVSIAPDLVDINAWRYQRQISGGIQEFMEAISFSHYLSHQSLISLSEASQTLPPEITLTSDDYILGIFDLTGELMRFAITTMATSGELPGSSDSGPGGGKRDILMDLRMLRTCFETLDTSSCGGFGLGKDWEKKMEVMKTSVQKVEMAVYGMIVRGAERPKGWIPDMPDEKRAVESY